MALSEGHSRARAQSGSSEQHLVATYQTRVCCYAAVERDDGDAALDAYAELYGRVERGLFAEVTAGPVGDDVEE